jgi:uncharacterized protein YbjT (DUF2867 family)
MGKTVLLLGATGLVGRELLDLLLHDTTVDRVRVIARRTTGTQHPKLEEHVVDLGDMERHPSLFAVDAIFCALGTTIKVAGSQERFRVIDHDYPILAARLGRQQNVPHYLLVSALGADPRSRVFYNRVKGDVERDLVQLQYPRVTIARPSLLLGDRAEFRFGERMFKPFGWLMPPAYKPIEGRAVAGALVRAMHTQIAGVEVLESRVMREQRA